MEGTLFALLWLFYTSTVSRLCACRYLLAVFHLQVITRVNRGHSGEFGAFLFFKLL